MKCVICECDDATEIQLCAKCIDDIDAMKGCIMCGKECTDKEAGICDPCYQETLDALEMDERMHEVVTALEKKRCRRCERPGWLCECIDPTKDDNLPF